jgi:hypothetical protein
MDDAGGRRGTRTGRGRHAMSKLEEKVRELQALQ